MPPPPASRKPSPRTKPIYAMSCWPNASSQGMQRTGPRSCPLREKKSLLPLPVSELARTAFGRPCLDLWKDVSTYRLAQAAARPPRFPAEPRHGLRVYRGGAAFCVLSAGAVFATDAAALADSSDFLYLGSLR